MSLRLMSSEDELSDDEWKELLGKLDLKKALKDAMLTIMVADFFPPIYFEGDEIPKRYGFSGEEI